MRPRSIVIFERLYLLALLVAAVAAVANWDRSLSFAGSVGFGPGLVILTQLIGLGLMTLLIFLISRRRSVTAKWLLTILFLFGLIFVGRDLPMLLRGGLSGVLPTLQILLQGAAIALLFTRASRAWLSGTSAGGDSARD